MEGLGFSWLAGFHPCSLILFKQPKFFPNPESCLEPRIKSPAKDIFIDLRQNIFDIFVIQLDVATPCLPNARSL